MNTALNAVLTAALLLLAAWALRRTLIRSRKGGGCCGEHESAEKKVTVSDRNKAHYPYAVLLQIGGMTCENCARKVENALNLLDGTWAVVSVSGGSAKVLSKTPPDEAAIREAVHGAGYVVTDYRLEERELT